MNWIDYAIIGVISISALVSVLRGFVKEALSLVTWIVALWSAFTFFEQLAPAFSQWIAVPSARLALAFVAIFLAVLVAGGVVNFLVSQLVQKTGLSGTDRVLGMVFGAARGAVLVAILVLLAGLTAFPEDPWWQESRLIGHFESLATWLRDMMPEELARNIHFDGPGDGN